MSKYEAAPWKVRVVWFLLAALSVGAWVFLIALVRAVK